MSDLPPLGSIGLVRVEGITGELIRIGQWLNGDGFEDYEHAFILVDGGDPGPAQVIEAEPGGVRRVPLSEYSGRDVLWLPCPPELGAGVVSAAEAYLDVPYSYADYFAIAAHRLMLDPVHLFPHVVDGTHHVMCSQLTAACARKSGWPLMQQHQWDGYTTPADLYRLAPRDAVAQRIG